VAAEAAARCGPLVAGWCDVRGRSVGRAGGWRGNDVGSQAHRGALRGCEGDVGNVVGIVAADEGEKGDDHVGNEDEADQQDAPVAVGGAGDERVNGGAAAVSMRFFWSERVHLHSIAQQLHLGGDRVGAY
jgi:hypothetical protein